MIRIIFQSSLKRSSTDQRQDPKDYQYSPHFFVSLKKSILRLNPFYTFRFASWLSFFLNLEKKERKLYQLLSSITNCCDVKKNEWKIMRVTVKSVATILQVKLNQHLFTKCQNQLKMLKKTNVTNWHTHSTWNHFMKIPIHFFLPKRPIKIIERASFCEREVDKQS